MNRYIRNIDRYMRNIRYMGEDPKGYVGEDPREALSESARGIPVSLSKMKHLVNDDERRTKTFYLYSISDNWHRKILDSVNNRISMGILESETYHEMTEEASRRADVFCRHAAVLKIGILDAKEYKDIEKAFTVFERGIAKDYAIECMEPKNPHQQELLFGAETLRK